MSLFKTTAELKVFCPSFNRNMAWNTLSPKVDQAERKYIIPLIGKEQYTVLEAAYQAGTISDKLEALLPYVQRPLAYYTHFELLPELMAMESDMGLQEQESSEGTSSPARQWVYEEKRKNAIENADAFADAMLEFLEENHGDYAEWKGSSAFTITKQLFINTSDEYNDIVSIGRSKRVWLALWPFVNRAETEYILPAITEPLFTDLKAKLLASLTTPLSTEYATLLLKIKEALAWLALYKALPFQVVQFTPSGIVQTTTANGIKSQKPADRIVFENARTEAETNGLSALRALKQYLEENSSSYDKYSDPNAYSQPNYEIPNNQGKKSFMV